MNTYEKAINEVIEHLIIHGVPFTVNQAYEGLQLRFPWCDGDVVCHAGTYGAEDGMVETHEFPWDVGDVSMLTPANCSMKVAIQWYLNEQ